jgi:cyclic beta-1,2-glucan synthetase
MAGVGGQLSQSLEESSWDGEWYLRGFFDNGAALGSHANEEAKSIRCRKVGP